MYILSINKSEEAKTSLSTGFWKVLRKFLGNKEPPQPYWYRSVGSLQKYIILGQYKTCLMLTNLT